MTYNSETIEEEPDGHINVTIEGYGVVKILRPIFDDYSSGVLEDLAAEAVRQTMALVKPIDMDKKFHPALGIGGYKK